MMVLRFWKTPVVLGLSTPQAPAPGVYVRPDMARLRFEILPCVAGLAAKALQASRMLSVTAVAAGIPRASRLWVVGRRLVADGEPMSLRWPSYPKRKNSLSLTIGPPMVAPKSLIAVSCLELPVVMKGFSASRPEVRPKE